MDDENTSRICNTIAIAAGIVIVAIKGINPTSIVVLAILAAAWIAGLLLAALIRSLINFVDYAVKQAKVIPSRIKDKWFLIPFSVWVWLFYLVPADPTEESWAPVLIVVLGIFLAAWLFSPESEEDKS